MRVKHKIDRHTGEHILYINAPEFGVMVSASSEAEAQRLFTMACLIATTLSRIN